MSTVAPVSVLDTPELIGAYVAAEILARVRHAETAGRPILIGLPTGRTPQPVYQWMAAILGSHPQPLSHVTLVMMDEYVREGTDGFEYARAPGVPSCHAYTDAEIIGPMNAVLPAAQQIPEGSVWFPDPRDPGAYDVRIRDAGGIDFFLLASGASDGHVAFNPPGTALDSRTRVIRLSEATRRDNLRTFPALGTLEQVPTHGVSVGLGTIADAREVMMLAWGEGKRETVRRMRAAHGFELDWPATVVHACQRATVLVDRDAAG